MSNSELESLRERAARWDADAVRQLIELAAEREDLEELRRHADGGSRDAADQLVEIAAEKSDLEELRRLAAYATAMLLIFLPSLPMRARPTTRRLRAAGSAPMPGVGELLATGPELAG